MSLMIEDILESLVEQGVLMYIFKQEHRFFSVLVVS